MRKQRAKHCLVLRIDYDWIELLILYQKYLLLVVVLSFVRRRTQLPLQHIIFTWKIVLVKGGMGDFYMLTRPEKKVHSEE
ncbi:hypothetical protein J2X69_003367 [Algoriphagus sp. 4150]|nr:hypothetical protein [Algoriphagus sp. 4150]